MVAPPGSRTSLADGVGPQQRLRCIPAQKGNVEQATQPSVLGVSATQFYIWKVQLDARRR